MQISELFLFSSNSKEELVKLLKETTKLAATISNNQLAEFSKSSNEKIDFNKKFKAALVAKDVDDLCVLLKKLLEIIPIEKAKKNNDLAIYFSDSSVKPKLALLFPSQGCQKINSAQILVKRFLWAKKISEKIDKDLLEKIFVNLEENNDKNVIENLTKSENAQVSVTLSSLLWLEFLKKLGIKADIVAGHGLGELVALYEAGSFNIDDLISTAILCGQAMGNTKIIGTMIELFCNEEKARRIITDIKDVQIANINSPNQIVISGSKSAIAEAKKRADKNSVKTYDLVVGNAFHSNLMLGAANYFSENFKANKKFTPSHPTFFSSMTGKKMDGEIDLKDYLNKQITSVVKFGDAVRAIEKEVDFAIEVGSGNALKNLVEKTSDKIFCCNVESDVTSFFDFNVTLANLFIRNFVINLDELYKDYKAFDFKGSIESTTNDVKEDFTEDLKKFAEKNAIELPIINSDSEEGLNIEPINYRTDYQWSGLLNGHSKNFLKLAEITEKNTAGTIILSIEEIINKTQLFNGKERSQIELLNNDQSHFLFKISSDVNQILIITKIFSGTGNNKKIISIIVKNKIRDMQSAPTEDITIESQAEEQKSNSDNQEKDEGKENLLEKKKLIHISAFRTSLNDASSIGNIYCTTYCKWQNEAFDEFIYKVDPTFFSNQDQKFLCLESNIKRFDNLRPFDKVEAKLHIENFGTDCFELSCDFYSTKKEKLAEGRQKIVFLKKIDYNYLPESMPQIITDYIKSC